MTSRIQCAECDHWNNALMKWCLNCGSYCPDAISASTEIDELFSSSLYKPKSKAHQTVTFAELKNNQSEDDSKVDEIYVNPGGIREDFGPVQSIRNPYYSNKSEFEDYLRVSFADWDTCYKSVSLRESVGNFEIEPVSRILPPRAFPDLDELSSKRDESIRTTEGLSLAKNVVEGVEDISEVNPYSYSVGNLRESIGNLEVEPVSRIFPSRAVSDLDELYSIRDESIRTDKILSLTKEVGEDIYEDKSEINLYSLTFDHAVAPIELPPPSTDCAEFFELTPRIVKGDCSFLLSLPPELLVYILSLLSPSDLFSVMLVCKKLYMFAGDPTLWRSIVIRNKTLQDTWMLPIGNRKPQALSIVCCDGYELSSSGLAELFKTLQNCLISFTLRASYRGALAADNVILRLASQCEKNVSTLDLAWSALSDVGLSIVAASFVKVSHIDLSGCQAITNDSFCSFIRYRGANLKSLILCQNSKLSESSFECISQNCTNLNRLEFNSFSQLNNMLIDAVCSASNENLLYLSVENCTNLTDISVYAISESCKNLEHINLAKNAQFHRHIVSVIAENFENLKSLNLSRISDIEDDDLVAVGNSCPQLQSLDVSNSPKITSNGIIELLNASTQLKAITLTGCSKIKEDKEYFKSQCLHSIAVVM